MHNNSSVPDNAPKDQTLNVFKQSIERATESLKTQILSALKAAGVEISGPSADPSMEYMKQLGQINAAHYEAISDVWVQYNEYKKILVYINKSKDLQNNDHALNPKEKETLDKERKNYEPRTIKLDTQIFPDLAEPFRTPQKSWWSKKNPTVSGIEKVRTVQDIINKRFETLGKLYDLFAIRPNTETKKLIDAHKKELKCDIEFLHEFLISYNTKTGTFIETNKGDNDLSGMYRMVCGKELKLLRVQLIVGGALMRSYIDSDGIYKKESFTTFKNPKGESVAVPWGPEYTNAFQQALQDMIKAYGIKSKKIKILTHNPICISIHKSLVPDLMQKYLAYAQSVDPKVAAGTNPEINPPHLGNLQWRNAEVPPQREEPNNNSELHSEMQANIF